MTKGDWFFFGFFVGALTVGLLIGFLFRPVEYGYGRGQIDALTGNVKYHLVTLPDSTREWQEIKP